MRYKAHMPHTDAFFVFLVFRFHLFFHFIRRCSLMLAKQKPLFVLSKYEELRNTIRRLLLYGQTHARTNRQRGTQKKR